jgi:hypothetical protein
MENLKMFDPQFLEKVGYFSKPTWTTHRQILHATQCNAWLLNDI